MHLLYMAIKAGPSLQLELPFVIYVKTVNVPAAAVIQNVPADTNARCTAM